MLQSSIQNDLMAAFPKENAPAAALNAIDNWIQSGRRIGIACSGGVDSVFALYWLLSIYNDYRQRMVVLHFNHNTRGEASEADEAFVTHLAEKEGLRIETERRKTSLGDSEISENSLRENRLSFYRKIIEQDNLFGIVTGHHSDDRNETLLMRLSRGSTLDGLIAPRPTSDVLKPAVMIRPLLDFEKADVQKWMRRHQLDWCEDASNKENRYYRNFVRNELLTNWSKNAPQNLAANLRSSIKYLDEDAIALNRWATSEVNSKLNDHEPFFPMKAFETLPIAIQRRALLTWLESQHLADRVRMQLIDSLLEDPDGHEFAIDETHTLRIDDERRIWVKTHESMDRWEHLSFHCPVNTSVYFPDGSKFRCERIFLDDDLFSFIKSGQCNQNHQAFVQTTGASTKIHFWTPGMKYQPLGMRQTKKLQDCFIDKKIPKSVRHKLPVVHDQNGSILWVPGLQPSEIARVEPTSKSVLQLTYSLS
jgi:tRNA(Ile)-lysidine synthase